MVCMTLAPYRDERVVVIGLRRVDVLAPAVVLALLAVVRAAVLLAVVPLVVETTAATGALVAAVLAVVAAVPKAAQPPRVPTIVAVATADFSPATSCWRREVSVRAIEFSPFSPAGRSSR
jgi:hypothetical protein